MCSKFMPCHMCAGTIVQFGIARVVVGKSKNFPVRNRLDLTLGHGVEVAGLDLDELTGLLGEFIGRNPDVWSRGIGAQSSERRYYARLRRTHANSPWSPS